MFKTTFQSRGVSGFLKLEGGGEVVIQTNLNANSNAATVKVLGQYVLSDTSLAGYLFS